MRYYLWMLNCSRAEWFERVLAAYKAGYRHMPTYYREVVRGKAPRS